LLAIFLVLAAKEAYYEGSHLIRGKEKPMEWTSPEFEEISLNCEINSYASAEL